MMSAPVGDASVLCDPAAAVQADPRQHLYAERPVGVPGFHGVVECDVRLDLIGQVVVPDVPDEGRTAARTQHDRRIPVDETVEIGRHLLDHGADRGRKRIGRRLGDSGRTRQREYENDAPAL